MVGIGSALFVIAGIFVMGWAIARPGVKIGTRANWVALGSLIFGLGLALPWERLPQKLSETIVFITVLAVIVRFIVVLQLVGLRGRLRKLLPDPKPGWFERYFPPD